LINSELKSSYQLKLECKQISAKLLQEEQRYSKLLESSDNAQPNRHQITSLKQSIDKARLALSHVERKVEKSEQEIGGHVAELVRLD
jgi:hypothetical protein